MLLKYQNEIDAYSPSFDGYAEVENKAAFRWTFEDISHPHNFLPVTKTNPGNKKAFKEFIGWALSFFDTKQQAIDRLKHVSNDKPNAYKKLGTHVANGILQKYHGLCELQSDEFGHFNFFDYEGVDFVPDFNVIEQIGMI